jgi:hypothetical protein
MPVENSTESIPFVQSSFLSFLSLFTLKHWSKTSLKRAVTGK